MIHERKMREKRERRRENESEKPCPKQNYAVLQILYFFLLACCSNHSLLSPLLFPGINPQPSLGSLSFYRVLGL